MKPSKPVVVLVLLAAACASPTPTPSPTPSPASRAAAPAAVASPAAPAAVASEAHGAPLANVHRLAAGVLSGAVPAGDAGFDALVALGVRTVISVDGATPDVARAAARGLRYVHIPITYAEVSAAERAELARAIRDLPGPVYVHCHHGKHRSPAAAAAAGVALGLVSPAQGVAFLRQAGTAPSYEGLYTSVACATRAPAAELDAAPAGFPAVRRPEGIVAAMLDVDEALEHLRAIQAAGWAVPAAHPDLVPAAEAGRLADGLRLSGEDPDARAHGEELLGRLAGAVEEAAGLEAALVERAPAAALDARLARVRASCTDCHRAHRDRR